MPFQLVFKLFIAWFVDAWIYIAAAFASMPEHVFPSASRARNRRPTPGYLSLLTNKYIGDEEKTHTEIVRYVIKYCSSSDVKMARKSFK